MPGKVRAGSTPPARRTRPLPSGPRHARRQNGGGAWLAVLPPRGLSRREARHCRRASVIALMQLGNTAMTRMSDGAYVTDLDNHRDNRWLRSRGYTIRHIETWHRFGPSKASSSGTRPRSAKPTCPTEQPRAGPHGSAPRHAFFPPRCGAVPGISKMERGEQGALDSSRALQRQNRAGSVGGPPRASLTEDATVPRPARCKPACDEAGRADGSLAQRMNT
jgi:hypothetical protein